MNYLQYLIWNYKHFESIWFKCYSCIVSNNHSEITTPYMLSYNNNIQWYISKICEGIFRKIEKIFPQWNQHEVELKIFHGKWLIYSTNKRNNMLLCCWFIRARHYYACSTEEIILLYYDRTSEALASEFQANIKEVFPCYW